MGHGHAILWWGHGEYRTRFNINIQKIEYFLLTEFLFPLELLSILLLVALIRAIVIALWAQNECSYLFYA